jgi:hypothetical protein
MSTQTSDVQTEVAAARQTVRRTFPKLAEFVTNKLFDADNADELERDIEIRRNAADVLTNADVEVLRAAVDLLDKDEEAHYHELRKVDEEWAAPVEYMALWCDVEVMRAGADWMEALDTIAQSYGDASALTVLRILRERNEPVEDAELDTKGEMLGYYVELCEQQEQQQRASEEAYKDSLLLTDAQSRAYDRGMRDGMITATKETVAKLQQVMASMKMLSDKAPVVERLAGPTLPTAMDSSDVRRNK